MKKHPLFADQIRYLPLRLSPASWQRRFFLKRAGTESGVFSYHPDLAQCHQVFLLLPEEDASLFVLLPLVLEIAKGKDAQSLFILAEEKHRHLLRALGLEGFSHFGSTGGMRYGESEFQLVERRIASHSWDLCLCLRQDFRLTDLYLAKLSNATYRIGVGCEAHYPFLNIALRPAQPSSPYCLRTLLCQQFQIEPAAIAAQAQDVVRPRGAAQGAPVHLSSSHVLLLNLEPPLEGNPWSVEELTRLCEAFASKFRLLALVSAPEQLAPYAEALESLQVRTAPVPATSGALFDMLRQYQGVLTLNSPHAHLILNLCSAKVAMLSEETGNWTPPGSKSLRVSPRNEEPRTLAQSVAAFMS